MEKIKREEQLMNIGMSVRAVNVLASVGVLTVGDLLEIPKEILDLIPNMGPKSLAAIYKFLKLNYKNIEKK